MAKLTIIPWSFYYAVYRDGDLVHFGERARDYLKLLQDLGFEVEHRPELMVNHGAPDFSWGKAGGGFLWRPPFSLTDFDRQLKAYQERRRLEELEYHKRRVAELEA